MRRNFTGVHIQFEPADRSVGIMAESFSAWPLYGGKAEDTGPWCELVDVATGECRWENSATGEPANKPGYIGDLVELTLKHFVEQFYAMERD